MKPIIVLGMHRSGTSAITRAIGLLGAGMGDARRMRKHWENIPLRRINERLITIGKGTWDAPPEAGWWDTARARKQLADGRQTVAQQFGTESIAVWKDPRTCLTLPFWREAFDEDPVYLIIHRHPTEVADSLTSRNHLGRGHGYAIWERYNADALRYAEGRSAVVLAYDTLVSDPVGSLATVCDALAGFGVPLPKDPASTDHGLVAQERHHTAGSADTIDGGMATASQHELFDLLRDLNGAHAALTLPRPVPAPHPLSLELFDLIRRSRQATKERTRRQGDDPGDDDEIDDPGRRVKVGLSKAATSAAPPAPSPAQAPPVPPPPPVRDAEPTGDAVPVPAPLTESALAGGAPALAGPATAAEPAAAPDERNDTDDIAARRARRAERRKNAERRATRRAAARATSSGSPGPTRSVGT